jgi:hypothetical protein
LRGKTERERRVEEAAGGAAIFRMRLCERQRGRERGREIV